MGMILLVIVSTSNRDNNVLIVVGLDALKGRVDMDFKTDLFQAVEPANRNSSDGWGGEFAQWLQPQLEARGYIIQALNDDSCGWNMVLQNKPFTLQVNCIVGTGDMYSNAQVLGVGKDEAVWTCFAHTIKPLFKSMFNKIDTAPAETKLQADLEAIVQAEPRIVLLGELVLASTDSDRDSDDN
jgi:hypothetical protein